MTWLGAIARLALLIAALVIASKWPHVLFRPQEWSLAALIGTVAVGTWFFRIEP